MNFQTYVLAATHDQMFLWYEPRDTAEINWIERWSMLCGEAESLK